MSNASPSSEDKNRLISLPEAAELYGFDQRYLAKLARSGRLKARKIGDLWVTTPLDMDIYIASRKKRGAYRDDVHPLN